MLSRHAASVAPERAALATSVRALLAFLPARGEHARGCPGPQRGICAPECQRAREALREARVVLFPWMRANSRP